MTRQVPITFWTVQTSSNKETAGTDEKIGEVFTMGADRATPMPSIPMYPNVCPIPGAKIPAAIRIGHGGHYHVWKRDEQNRQQPEDRRSRAQGD
jgi:hypothetical protein